MTVQMASIQMIINFIMNEDDLILLILYVIFWITLYMLFRFKHNKNRVLNVNLTIQGIYSVILLFSYKIDSSGGASLAVFVVWLVILNIHLLTIVFQLIFIFIKKYINR